MRLITITAAVSALSLASACGSESPASTEIPEQVAIRMPHEETGIGERVSLTGIVAGRRKRVEVRHFNRSSIQHVDFQRRFLLCFGWRF